MYNWMLAAGLLEGVAASSAESRLRALQDTNDNEYVDETCSDLLKSFRDSNGMNYTQVNQTCFSDQECPSSAKNSLLVPVRDAPCTFVTYKNSTVTSDCETTFSTDPPEMLEGGPIYGSYEWPLTIASYTYLDVPDLIAGSNESDSGIGVYWGLWMDCDGYVYLFFQNSLDTNYDMYTLKAFGQQDDFLESDCGGGIIGGSVSIGGIGGAMAGPPGSCPEESSTEQFLEATCELTLAPPPACSELLQTFRDTGNETDIDLDCFLELDCAEGGGGDADAELMDDILCAVTTTSNWTESDGCNTTSTITRSSEELEKALSANDLSATNQALANVTTFSEATILGVGEDCDGFIYLFSSSNRFVEK